MLSFEEFRDEHEEDVYNEFIHEYRQVPDDGELEEAVVEAYERYCSDARDYPDYEEAEHDRHCLSMAHHYGAF